PCVAVLFAFRNDGKQEDTGFVKCLEMLAKDRDWLNEFNDARQNRRFGATSGHAHAICSLQCEYVLVVLDFEDCVLPGTDAQILFLLNCDGDYLDHMVCGISNRLTSWINGRFQTNISERPDNDGAIAFIRLDGIDDRSGFPLYITHKGEQKKYSMSEDTLPAEHHTKRNP